MTTDLTPYRGQWVAVRAGRLIGHAETAIGIIDVLLRSGPAKGATAWYECHPHEVKRWAVMDPGRGRIGPNCYFDTEAEAVRWRASWHEFADHVIVTRDGQHDPWRPAGQ